MGAAHGLAGGGQMLFADGAGDVQQEYIEDALTGGLQQLHLQRHIVQLGGDVLSCQRAQVGVPIPDEHIDLGHDRLHLLQRDGAGRGGAQDRQQDCQQANTDLHVLSPLW